MSPVAIYTPGGPPGALSIQPKSPEVSVGSSNGTDHFGLVWPEYSGPALKVVHCDQSGHFGRSDRNVTWDQALFSFRFENYIPALISAVAVRENVESVDFWYLALTVSNNWRNTTRRWKKVCVIKLQLYKSPWESAYYKGLKPVDDI